MATPILQFEVGTIDIRTPRPNKYTALGDDRILYRNQSDRSRRIRTESLLDSGVYAITEGVCFRQKDCF
jgi:hypothetical protein